MSDSTRPAARRSDPTRPTTGTTTGTTSRPTDRRRAPHVNARRKQARRRFIALRDGLHCAYCRRPFTDPQEATLDHIVPRCLLPSWDPAFLVLACDPCNQAKGNRLPLILALLLADLANGATGRPA